MILRGYYFGFIFISPYTSGYRSPVFDFTSNGVLGLLVDREHGVFAYFPALYLVFFGLVVSMKRLGRRIVVVGLMCAMFYGLVAFYWGWKQLATTAGREILPIVYCAALLSQVHSSASGRGGGQNLRMYSRSIYRAIFRCNDLVPIVGDSRNALQSSVLPTWGGCW
jgi:hypothetical protein